MIYVSTHAGKRHTVSEDAVLVGKQILTETSGTFPVPQQGFVSVADGVGGNRGGIRLPVIQISPEGNPDHLLSLIR